MRSDLRGCAILRAFFKSSLGVKDASLHVWGPVLDDWVDRFRRCTRQLDDVGADGYKQICEHARSANLHENRRAARRSEQGALDDAPEIHAGMPGALALAHCR